ncbi:hypothetical protein [Mucilaginibacter sp.]|uniref:hypothetical protein n=1 Tax=Mucilaginibacter sp. TaxID=1882438 RepID=UPI002614C79E|nr:hypothetical protein [Mucilaginibacter sp.]MDB5128341.1 hypothetical protein [Mucilaginibacter sp.]
MEITTDEQTLQYLWEALQTEPRRPRYHWAEQKFCESLKRGWLFYSDIEDMLIAMDSRVDSGGFRIMPLVEHMGISFEEVYFRPRAISSGAMRFDALRPEYYVYLLIQLERVGLAVDTARYVDIMLPSILPRNRKLFSVAELEIFWYKRTRHKQEDVVLYTDKSLRYEEYGDPLKLNSGFTLTLGLDAEDKPFLLMIRAPKYKPQRAPVEVSCPGCGHNYHKGDPESSMLHRKEHKKRMTWLQPQALPAMLLERAEKGPFAELVTCDSPAWKHSEMYNRALAFKREFHYDFTQWKSPNSGREDPDVQGYLFTGEFGEIIGACAFRNRSDDPEIQKWGLQWIWLCPRERRKGHLEQRWRMFRQRFGNFLVEPPVSEAMQGFLKKQGDSELLLLDRKP